MNVLVNKMFLHRDGKINTVVVFFNRKYKRDVCGVSLKCLIILNHCTSFTSIRKRCKCCVLALPLVQCLHFMVLSTTDVIIIIFFFPHELDKVTCISGLRAVNSDLLELIPPVGAC